MLIVLLWYFVDHLNNRVHQYNRAAAIIARDCQCLGAIDLASVSMGEKNLVPLSIQGSFSITNILMMDCCMFVGSSSSNKCSAISALELFIRGSHRIASPDLSPILQKSLGDSELSKILHSHIWFVSFDYWLWIRHWDILALYKSSNDLPAIWI